MWNGSNFVSASMYWCLFEPCATMNTMNLIYASCPDSQIITIDCMTYNSTVNMLQNPK